MVVVTGNGLEVANVVPPYQQGADKPVWLTGHYVVGLVSFDGFLGRDGSSPTPVFLLDCVACPFAMSLMRAPPRLC